MYLKLLQRHHGIAEKQQESVFAQRWNVESMWYIIVKYIMFCEISILISCFVKYRYWYHVLCQMIHLYVCKYVCTDSFFIYLINQITLSVKIENVTIYCYDWAGQNIQRSPWVSAMRKIYCKCMILEVFQYLDVGHVLNNNILGNIVDNKYL